MSEKNGKTQDSWFERHSGLKWVVAFVFALPYAVIFVIASYYYGFLSVLSLDTLKAIIEAEATIIGFFVLVVVYLLNSYDIRLDRLEQELFDLVKQPPKDLGIVLIAGKREDALKQRKKNKVFAIIIIGLCLVISLFLSIIALGLVSLISNVSETGKALIVSAAFWTDVVGSMFLFIGTFGVFTSILSIAREEEPKELRDLQDVLMKSYQGTQEQESKRQAEREKKEKDRAQKT